MNLSGPEFLLLWFSGAAVAWMLTLILRTLLTSKRSTMPSIDELATRLHPTEVAYLAGGIERAIEAAVTGLHHRGLIEINGSNMTYVERPKLMPDGMYRGVVAQEELSRVEQFVIDHKTARVTELVDEASDLDRWLETKLKRDYLLVTNPGAVRIQAMLPMIAWLLFGLAKVFVGVSRDRPVTFLVLGLALFAYVGVKTAMPGRRTGKGDALLRQLKKRLHALETTATHAPQQLSGADMMLAYGVFGGALLGTSALALMMPSYQRQIIAAQIGSSSCGASSCGSSCSSCGGGCGGGCGGCS